MRHKNEMTEILNRLLSLRVEKQWSEYRLAQEAGISQSTISSLYRNQNFPSLPTLISLCDAFDCTLGQFFSEQEHSHFPDDELTFLHKYRALTTEQKQAILLLMDSI